MRTTPLTQTTIMLPTRLRAQLRAIAQSRGEPEGATLREALLVYLADPDPPAESSLERAALRLPASAWAALAALAQAQGLSLSALCRAAVARYCGITDSSAARPVVQERKIGAGHVSAASRPPP